ncbi:MAG: NUDIX domain-containing protein [Candidatus Latescibacteria bacterium]|nr:NUDIX domain-containing protein [Candidatus Latescibacterota bacterium]
MADINKIGLLVIKDGKFLMCRKDNFTSMLILPGGKIEKGETHLECLERELREELGEVTAINLKPVGVYHDLAHSDDPGIIKTLEIQVYQGDLSGDPRPCSEIVKLVWFGKTSNRDLLTPITQNKILPDIINRGILVW